MRPSARIDPQSGRLHLQHGPIDLIIGADGDRHGAFRAAAQRFETVLDELVTELPLLRQPMYAGAPQPKGAIARRLDKACRPFADETFVTCMAAVAGGVADTVLKAMTDGVEVRRAFVNNGGDIAIHLETGERFTMAMKRHDNADLGRIVIRDNDPVRGIATSGMHGRSLSQGIADSVTVLASTAAAADVAATLIANAVDVPGHPAIIRKPARDIDEQTDLGQIPVVVSCGALPVDACGFALTRGLTVAEGFIKRGLIRAAALHLQSQSVTTSDDHGFSLQRMAEHA